MPTISCFYWYDIERNRVYSAAQMDSTAKTNQQNLYLQHIETVESQPVKYEPGYEGERISRRINLCFVQAETEM